MGPETMGVRILLVDDNPDDRVMVERRLRRESPGIQIEQVSGAAGLDRAMDQGGFDLVITDYRLRWTDGIAVSRAVKARMPDCPVIMFTATGGEEVAVEAMKSGLDDYVVKSSKHLVRLVASVRAALERARQRAALREIEARYVRLFEHVPLGVYRSTPDGRILDVNPAFVQLMRCTSPEHALALNAADFYEDPEDRARFKTVIERTGVVRRFEVRARRCDGTVFWAENNTRAVPDAGGRVQLYEGTVQDVTERKQAEEALQESEARYRLLFDSSPHPAWVFDMETLGFLTVNEAAVRHYGYSREEFLGMTIMDIRPPEDIPGLLDRLRKAPIGAEFRGTYRHRKKNGDITLMDITVNRLTYMGRPAELVLAHDVSERVRSEEALRAQTMHLLLLQEITEAALSTPDYPTLMQTLADRLIGVIGADGCNINQWDEARQVPVLVAGTGGGRRPFPWVQPEPGEITMTGSSLALGRTLAVEDVLDTPHISHRIATKMPYSSALGVPLIAGEEKIGAAIMYFIEPRRFSPDEIARAEQAVNLLSLAVARARLLDLTQRHAEELAGQAQLFERLLSTRDLDQRLRYMLDGVMDLLGADIGGIYLVDGGEPIMRAWKGASEELLASMRALPVGTFAKWLQRTHIVRERPDEQGRMFEFAKHEGIQAWASIPLHLPVPQAGAEGGEWRGAILIASRNLNALPEDKVMAVERISQQLALFIAHSWVYRQAQNRMARLQALHEINLAITSSMDLRVTLAVLLSAVTSHLRVDAAAVLLLGRHTHTLEHAADRGFLTDAHRRVRLGLGEGPAGRAALERRTVVIPRLAEEEGLAGSPLVVAERFVAQVAVPLIAKGQVKGVLELFHRQPLDPNPEWLLFLEGLAAQAAIAVDSAELLEDLQRSNADLAMAYDATLEMSVRSLDLRDKETEGHTQRVAEMTVRLAAALGVPEADLVNVRRGALLHDVGKIGVPDAVLHKPGPLTEEEWVLMRRHPAQAREMLLPVPFLRPALDIPYSHHEKWDGTGYPQGLRGEHIPLAARIFAVVDVWDALRSDRPYRKAWDDEKAHAYIREQAGKHFDPRVVEAFFKLIGNSI
ncbi:MAG: PAS domain S-box protein [bacterium]|nr:PAS domain S-box protein [bacterium]